MDIHDLKIPIQLTKAGIKGALASASAEIKAELNKQVADAKAADKQKADSARASNKVRQADDKATAMAAQVAARTTAAAIKTTLDETDRRSSQSARSRAEEARRLAADQAFAAKMAADETYKADREAGSKAVEAAKEASKKRRVLWGEERQTLRQQVGSVEQLGKAFMNLQVFTQVANLIRQGMMAVGQSTAAARDHIKGLVTEMESARRESKELAALLGKSPTAGFTAGQALEAASVGLDVQPYQQFQLGFQAQTQQYVGAWEATPEELAKGGQKLSGEQAAQLQKRVASYMVGARGLGPEEAAKALGVVVAKSKAGASNDEIMTDVAKLMKVAELAPGKTSPMLGQIAEVAMESVGEGGDFNELLDAAYLVRIMAQRNPEEAGTYGRSLLRGLREARMDPKKSKPLGLKRGMGIFDQLKAVEGSLNAAKAKGGDEGEFLATYFKDIREFGAASTAIREGLRGGGFERTKAEAASVNAATADSAARAFTGGEEGRAAADRSGLVASQRKNAGYYVELRHLQNDAAKTMLDLHEFEMPESMVNSILTGAGAAFGQGSREEQRQRELVGHNINTRLGLSGEGQTFLREHGQFGAGSTERDLAEAANLLKRIADQNQRMLEGQPRGAAPIIPRAQNAAAGR